MIEWSEEAKKEWEAFLTRQRRALARSEGDPEEVVEDLRRHLDEELIKQKVQIVTRADIQRLTRSMGAVDPEPQAPSPSLRPAAASASARPRDPSKRSVPGVPLLIFGVFLPLISLLAELSFHPCAGMFFDPIPTWWHVLLVGSVPILNLFLIRLLRQPEPKLSRPLLIASGATVAIALYYAISFLPLLLPGLLAVLFFGYGLLPMGPLFAFIGALRCHLLAVRQFGTGKPSSLVPTTLSGLALGLLCLVPLEFPSVVARVGMELADSESPRVQQRGIQLLRFAGSEATMLRACYERPRKLTNFAALLISRDNELNQTEAREIFFRTTGKPFNTVRPPQLYDRNGRWQAFDDMTWDIDDGLGGATVAGRVRDLALTGSRIDGHIHSQAGLAYLEWTFEFTNDSRRQREARTQIQLPAGAVVSRLTLWVEGEEREAAFAGRAETRAAYQEVAVRQRRDPVLVTTTGPDRILMQCFPIPPNGGTMKTRVGITIPLAMLNPSEGHLSFPIMLERNFNLPPSLEHAIWIESRAPLETDQNELISGTKAEGEHTVQGQISDSALINGRTSIRVQRPEPTLRVATAALEKETHILQELIPTPPLDLERLVIAVDGSFGMDTAYLAAAESLEALPSDLSVYLIHADDLSSAGIHSRNQPAPMTAAQAAARLRELPAVGGQDNLRSLVQAWDLASGSPRGAVLWIHGPQPVMLSSDQALQQRLERNPNGPPIYELQTQIGPNRVVEAMPRYALRSVLRQGTLKDDLTRWFGGLGGESQSWTFTRKAVPDATLSSEPDLPRVTDHVRRLWAADQIEDLARRRFHKSAVGLAHKHQLVTSVSGAVVLETQEQYDRAGLQPVDAGTVPVIPEPKTWLLFLTGLAVLYRFQTARRRA